MTEVYDEWSKDDLGQDLPREYWLEALPDLFQYVTGCCLHNPLWGPEDAVEVLGWTWNGEYDGGNGTGPKRAWNESGQDVIVRLRDGAYGYFNESEDYTGHGCQCGSFAGKYPTLEDLWRDGVGDTYHNSATLREQVSASTQR